MSLGLFVTRWHGGTKNQQDTDEMLSFCDQLGVTDLYIHCHEDIAVKDDWDYLGYVLTNRGQKRVFAWLSTTVGRDNKNNYTKNFLTQKDIKSKSHPMEGWTVLTLDLADPKTNAYFQNRIQAILQNYPELSGHYIDGQELNGIKINCYSVTCAKTAQKLKTVTLEGKTPFLYCYGKLSYKETKEDLIREIQNAVS